MFLASGPRRLLILLAGALGLLVGSDSTRGEPDDGPRGVLRCNVSGWSEDAEARVELRRLADLRWTRCLRWDRPWSGDADPRHLLPWLAPGRIAGSPVASGSVAGGAGTFAVDGLAPGLYGVRVVPTTGPAATGDPTDGNGRFELRSTLTTGIVGRGPLADIPSDPLPPRLALRELSVETTDGRRRTIEHPRGRWSRARDVGPMNGRLLYDLDTIRVDAPSVEMQR